MLNIEPEVMYGAGSGSGWGKFVLFYFRVRILLKVKISGRRGYQLNCGFFFLVGDSQTIFNGSVFLDCFLGGRILC